MPMERAVLSDTPAPRSGRQPMPSTRDTKNSETERPPPPRCSLFKAETDLRTGKVFGAGHPGQCGASGGPACGSARIQ